MKTSIQFQLNGKPTSLHTDDVRMLLWVEGLARSGKLHPLQQAFI